MGFWETKIDRGAFAKGAALTGAGVALSPLIALAAVGTRSLSKETDSSWHVTFQPGIHPTTDADFIAIWDKFSKEGYIRPSIWNREVAQRMGKVTILAVDGAGPSDAPSYDEKVFAWQLLPDRPSQIASDGQRVLLVRGDCYHSNILNSFPTVSFNTVKEAVFENLAKRDTRSGPIPVEEQVEYAKKASLVALGIVSAEVLIAKAIAKPTEQKKDRLLSRRLALVTGVVSLVTLAESFTIFDSANYLSATSSNEGLRKFFEMLSETSPLNLQGMEGLYVNARTALLCAKLEDAMDDLGLPADTKAAIVMGDAHLDGANTLLKDKNVRRKLIREYAKLMIELVKQLVGNTVDDETIRISVTEQLAKYDVLEINDPGTIGNTDIAFPAQIDQYVKPHQSNRWGSRQVMDAVKGLY